jgi:hypothetical protein
VCHYELVLSNTYCGSYRCVGLRAICSGSQARIAIVDHCASSSDSSRASVEVVAVSVVAAAHSNIMQQCEACCLLLSTDTLCY